MRRKEGRLQKNERGRYELDENTQFTCGCGIELKICETWVKTGSSTTERTITRWGFVA